MWFGCYKPVHGGLVGLHLILFPRTGSHLGNAPTDVLQQRLLQLLVDGLKAPQFGNHESGTDVVVVAANSGERLSQGALAVQLLGNEER